jgi:hypothetical protein
MYFFAAQNMQSMLMRIWSLGIAAAWFALCRNPSLLSLFPRVQMRGTHTQNMILPVLWLGTL